MRRLLVLLRIVVSFGILAILFSRLDLSKLASTLARANPILLALSGILAIAYTTLKVLRWSFLVEKAGAPVSPYDGWRSYLGGMAVGIVTPGRLGEIARSLYLPARNRLAFTVLALADKVLDVWAILVFAIAGATLLFGKPAGLGLAIASVFLAALGFAGPRVHAILPRRAREALAGLSRLRPGAIVRAEGLAVVTFALVLLQFHAIGAAFREIPLAVSFLVLPLVILSNLIPLSISGLGIREGAAVLLFARYDVPAEVAVSMSLLLFVENTAIPALFGLLLTRGLRTHGTEEHGRREAT